MNEDPLAPKISANSLDNIMAQVRCRDRRNGHKKYNSQKKTDNRWCRICTRTWHKQQFLIDPQLKPDICSVCQLELDKGQIAVTTVGGRHCFIYSFSLAGQGPIIEVSPEVMDKVEEEAKKQKPPTEGEKE